MSNDAREELLTVQEYAKRLRVHIQTVYSAIRYKRFPYRVIRVTDAKRSPIRIVVPRGSISERNTT